MNESTVQWNHRINQILRTTQREQQQQQQQQQPCNDESK
jgi:hypothetical protein